MQVYALAQQAIEAKEPLKPALAMQLMEEIVRLRRMLHASEAKIRRMESANERMDLHRERRAEGPAASEGDEMGRGSEDVDPIDG